MKIKSVLLQILIVAFMFGVGNTTQADISGKIIGGTIAPNYKYPSTVAILFKDNFDIIVNGQTSQADPVDAHFQSQFCAGTLIDPEWVLTAAHCMIDFVPGELLILEGTQTLAITDNDTVAGNVIPESALPGNRITVTDIIRHPDYNVDTFDSDLALLKLSAPATQTTVALFSGTVPLSTTSTSATTCAASDNCASIVGWGTDDAVNGNTFPLDLLEAQLPIVTNQTCLQDIGSGITSNMLCAGFELGGKDTCQGDSGGPLYMSVSGNGATTATDLAIAGITSFGNGCANPDSPGVYTRISEFTTYINNFMSGNTSASAVPVITSTQTNYVASTALNTPVQVAAITATDGDNDDLYWKLTDGNRAGDANFFAIDTNGNVTLTSVPASINNTYELLIKVTDQQDGSDFIRLTITLNNSGVSSASSNVSAAPASVDADGTSQATVIVSLNNDNGTAVQNAGNVVSIASTGNAVVSTVTNNGNGTYTATLTNDTAESVTVTAAISGSTIDQTAAVTFDLVDNDGDGIADSADPDDDNDGVDDFNDVFPFDSSETSDNDGDFIGDNADLDDDNDGVLDIDDAFPFDNTETIDSDGDGIGDNADPTPNGENNGQLVQFTPVAAVASSFENTSFFVLPPENAVDADTDTRWSSEFTDNEWIYVDLGGEYIIDRVYLDWETAFGKKYELQISDDAQNWTTIFTETNGDGGLDEINFPQATARYVRMLGVERGTPWGYSLYEIVVRGRLNNQAPDNDGDGIPDSIDADDDNDGVDDINDVFPFDDTETSDNDGDLFGDNADLDDDNDGVVDVDDAFPFDDSETTDSDGDGIGDNFDPTPNGMIDNLPTQRLIPVSVSLDGITLGNRSSSPDTRGASLASLNSRFIVYSSNAENLVETEITTSGIYVYDRIKNTNELISLGLNGEPPNSFSVNGSISNDGRYVAFLSLATNLVPNFPDSISEPQAYLYDRKLKTLLLISTDSEGNPANRSVVAPQITADGTTVIFQSYASNLEQGDTGFSNELYLYDIASENIKRADLIPAGAAPNFSLSGSVTLSSDSNLVVGTTYDNTGPLGIFIYDIGLDTTNYIDPGQGSAAIAVEYINPVISADGNVIIFAASTTDLVDNDQNNRVDLFAYDRTDNSIDRVNTNSAGDETAGVILDYAINADGRFVAFSAATGDLVATDENGQSDVFIKDRLTGAIEVVSLGSNGEFGNGFSSSVSIDPTARFVLFTSNREDFFSDSNTTIALMPSQTYLYDRQLALSDFDGDGLIDTIDTDDDNDGVTDENDAFPFDNTETLDSDGDGIGDNSDSTPNGETSAQTIQLTPITAVASSFENTSFFMLPAELAIDGDNSTRWGSNFSWDEWIYVDLGVTHQVERVVLNWEIAFAMEYHIQVSDDAVNWITVYVENNGDGNIDDISFTPVDTRYIRMFGTKRATPWGFSLYEFEVYGKAGMQMPDYDMDGIPDSIDADDDNDMVNDIDDAFPFDASETTDTDGDGVGDNADATPNGVSGLRWSDSTFVTSELKNDPRTVRLTYEAEPGSPAVELEQLVLLREANLDVSTFYLMRTEGCNTAVGCQEVNYDPARILNPGEFIDVEIFHLFGDIFNSDGRLAARYSQQNSDEEMSAVLQVTLPSFDANQAPAQLIVTPSFVDFGDIGINDLTVSEEIVFNNAAQTGARWVGGPDLYFGYGIGNNSENRVSRGAKEIVSFNQLGFNVDPSENRSATLSATPIALGFATENRGYTFDYSYAGATFYYNVIADPTATLPAVCLDDSLVFNVSTIDASAEFSKTITNTSVEAFELRGFHVDLGTDEFVYSTDFSASGFPQITGNQPLMYNSQTGCPPQLEYCDGTSNHSELSDIINPGESYDLEFTWLSHGAVAGQTYSGTLLLATDKGTVRKPITIAVDSPVTIPQGENCTTVPVTNGIIAAVGVLSSSVEKPSTLAEFSIDGDTDTRWSSNFTDDEWIYVDLGTNYSIDRVYLDWETAFGKQYQLQVSTDAQNWTTIFTETNGDGLLDEINFAAATARYVRMLGIERGTPWGYSLYEIVVRGQVSSQIPDSDMDGVNDQDDAFPFNASETTDTDNDGTGNNADTDDDGDGVNDLIDVFPLDDTESSDSDADGIGDNSDSEFNAPTRITSLISPVFDKSRAANQSVTSVDGISISDGGRFTLFVSGSKLIVQNDTTLGANDLFAYDRITDQTELISVSSDGVQGNLDSGHGAISADGRYVAFSSKATNLVNTQVPVSNGIYLRDRLIGTTELIAGNASRPAISANGDKIVFEASGDNLLSNDTNGKPDIFVFNRNTGAIELISVNSNGEQADQDSMWPSISRDGRFVVFSSAATNLATEISQPTLQVYVRDLLLQTTELVSVTNNGEVSNASAAYPQISADNEYVAFMSDSTNLVPNSNIQSLQVFVYKRSTGTFEIVSTNGPGEADENNNYLDAISEDGRYILFGSVDSNDNTRVDTYLYDRQNDSLILINSTESGGFSDSGTRTLRSHMDVTGSFVSFQSQASDIDTRYAVNGANVYLFNREAAGDDLDGDLIANGFDLDDDGDGIADTVDAFPLDASETLDSDGDGVGDNADAFPFDSTETTDTDGDGIGDNTDPTPNGEISGDPIKFNLVDAVASSFENTSSFVLPPDFAIDGDTNTRWGSNFGADEWIYVDLGSSRIIEKVELLWEAAYASHYQIQLSEDAVNWTSIVAEMAGDGGTDILNFTPVSGRYVRMLGIERATPWGYSLYEFNVFGVQTSACSSYEYFNDSLNLWDLDLLENLSPVATGEIDETNGNPFDITIEPDFHDLAGTAYNFNVVLPSVDGDVFEIRLQSDDGSRLYASDSSGEILLIDNDGVHAVKSNSVRFNVTNSSAGVQPISLRVEYFNAIDSGELSVYLSKNDGPESKIACSDILITNGICSIYEIYQDPILEYSVDNLRDSTSTGVISNDSNNPFDITVENPVTGANANFGYIYKSRIEIPQDGQYEFVLNSVEASTLSIDGTKIVDNEGIHPAPEIADSRTYSAGIYDLEVRYLFGAGTNPTPDLDVSWSGPGYSRQAITCNNVGTN